VEYRPGTVHDIAPIAALHADSWRRSYRGVYSDAYLDGDVLDDRLAVWTERLSHPSDADDTVVAEANGEIVGFAHTILEDDPQWGALLDNLHVAHGIKRSGIGRELMARSASAVLTRGVHRALYLMVLEANTSAQAFYDACGGECVGREDWEPPGGGTVVALRYAWRNPALLMATTR
jgi:ribosomal protein S18 acetylase RimI-like enzyme